MLREEAAFKQAEAARTHRRQITKNEKRIAELNTLYRKTYEDFAAGRLPEQRFEQLSGGYETEQAGLERQTAGLREELDRFDADSERGEKFMELARRYGDFSELTPAMLHEFIEKVVVHEADRSSGRREQDVDIYLNFIGRFDVPSWYEIEEEEPAALTPEEQKRAKWREYARKSRDRKIAARLAAEKGEPAEKETPNVQDGDCA